MQTGKHRLTIILANNVGRFAPICSRRKKSQKIFANVYQIFNKCWLISFKTSMLMAWFVGLRWGWQILQNILILKNIVGNLFFFKKHTSTQTVVGRNVGRKCLLTCWPVVATKKPNIVPLKHTIL